MEKERVEEILRMRRGGLSFEQIAERLEVDEDTAYRVWLEQSKVRLSPDDFNTLRSTEAERLDAAQAAVWSKVLRGEVPSVLAMLRIMERRAKLLGLDANEVRQQQEVTVDDAFSRLIESFSAPEASDPQDAP